MKSQSVFKLGSLITNPQYFLEFLRLGESFCRISIHREQSENSRKAETERVQISKKSSVVSGCAELRQS